MMLAIVGGIVGDHPPIAWAGAVLFLASSLLFGFSMGFYIPFAGLLVGVVLVWDASRRWSPPDPSLHEAQSP